MNDSQWVFEYCAFDGSTILRSYSYSLEFLVAVELLFLPIYGIVFWDALQFNSRTGTDLCLVESKAKAV